MTQQNLKNNPSSSLLKDTRQAKGLTLEIVHEATKIPMDALRAIEEGYSTRILTPFYYRGFVKIYSEFLGLKVADVLKEYNVQAPEVKVTSSVAKPVKTVKPAVTQAAKPTAKQEMISKAVKPQTSEPNYFLEELQKNFRQVWTPKTRMLLLRVLAAVVALFILVKMTGCVAGFFKNRPKAKPKTVTLAKKKIVVKKEESKEKPQEKPNPKPQEDQEEKVDEKQVVETKTHKVTLMARASRDGWIQVKTDGKVAFQMTMKKGTLENWEADNDIELSGKNLGDLDLEVNGKPVSSLGTFNRRAKKVLITKDGLAVKK